MLASIALEAGLQLPPLTDNHMCMNTCASAAASGSHKMHSHCRQCAPNAFCWDLVGGVRHLSCMQSILVWPGQTRHQRL